MRRVVVGWEWREERWLWRAVAAVGGERGVGEVGSSGVGLRVVDWWADEDEEEENLSSDRVR